MNRTIKPATGQIPQRVIAADIKKALTSEGVECPDWVYIEAAARLRHENRDWQGLCAEIENAGEVAK